MPERRLAAIMFTDIVGYTSLMGKDEKKAFEFLKNNRRIHVRLIKKYKGRWLKEMGDGILASFPSSIDAVMCALSIQAAAEEMDIPLRIGIHQGDVIFEKKDVLGDGVNIASRIQGVADTNGIVISETVFKDIKNKEGIDSEFLGEKTLKGVEFPVGSYKVICRDKDLLDYKIDTGELTRPLGVGKVSIAVGILIIAVLVLVLYYFVPELARSTLELEKSIAVLPFDNESANEDNIYFVNGMMEDIRNNLSKIGDFRVISKTSTEKYRETTLTAAEIADELNVNYLLEGTVQRLGNQVKIHAQLIEAEMDDHIWSNTYVRDITDLKEIFNVQSEIAQKIADKLYANITPDEQKIIETIPTADFTAYDFYLKARDQYNNYYFNRSNKNALEMAITLYRIALEYDSTYAQAYTGLAFAYWHAHENYSDSGFVLANKALFYDDQLDEAYLVRGIYYNWGKGEPNKALIELDKALQINPNYSLAYYQKAWSYHEFLENYVEAIKNFHKAANLDHSFFLPTILGNLSWAYRNIGFYDKSIYYEQEKLKLDNDSASYYRRLKTIDYLKSDFKTRLETDKNRYAHDSTHQGVIANLIENNIALGNIQEAYNYSLKLIELLDSIQVSDAGFQQGRIMRLIGYIGYAFWQVGKQEEAKYYFDEKTKLCLENILHNKISFYTKIAHYELAGVYAFLGDKEKAYQQLDQYNTYRFYRRGEIENIKIDPLFDPIREEERFQKIIENIEVNFRGDQERLRAWLEENDI